MVTKRSEIFTLQNRQRMICQNLEGVVHDTRREVKGYTYKESYELH